MLVHGKHMCEVDEAPFLIPRNPKGKAALCSCQNGCGKNLIKSAKCWDESEFLLEWQALTEQCNLAVM